MNDCASASAGQCLECQTMVIITLYQHTLIASRSPPESINDMSNPQTHLTLSPFFVSSTSSLTFTSVLTCLQDVPLAASWLLRLSRGSGAVSCHMLLI